jgi:prephenate dehydrogenase
MATYEVLSIGLGPVGASLGLALAQAEGDVKRLGYDPDKKIAQFAESAGAVDRLISHPRRAIGSADLIIFALPHHEVEVYLENLGAKVKPDAIVMDTASIRMPFFNWSKKHLPDPGNAIGATPIVGPLDDKAPVDEPSADAYAGGLVAVTSSPETSERALAVAINLAKLLDAEPFFLDVAEHDAATAAVEDLPTLLSSILVHTLTGSPSWSELQRMGGPLLAQSTALSDSDPKHVIQRVSANREYLLARLDSITQEIGQLRGLLASEDDEALMSYFETADQQRYAWLRARARGDWAAEELRRMPSIDSTGFIGHLFGLSQRKPKAE